MAKTNASFNLSKTVKRKLAGILDPIARNVYKKMMIDAEWAFTQTKSRKWSDPATSQKPSRESKEA